MTKGNQLKTTWDNVQISRPTQKEIKKVIKDLNVRPETLKLLGGNTEI